MLKIESISAGYRGGEVIREISLEVYPGEMKVVLGANGAGKSTLLRCISGLVPVMNGSISIGGQRLNHRPPCRIAQLGIGHCLEGKRVFPFLTVRDNLEVGSFLASDKKKANLDFVFHLFPVLKNRLRQKAHTLSGGERQMLAIGQTLMSSPRILLLDEPSAGLSPLFVESLAKAIRQISGQGTGILWAEQNARVALDYSDFGYLLSLGKVIYSGPSKELSRHSIVQSAYLGNGL